MRRKAAHRYGGHVEGQGLYLQGRGPRTVSAQPRGFKLVTPVSDFDRLLLARCVRAGRR